MISIGAIDPIVNLGLNGGNSKGTCSCVLTSTEQLVPLPSLNCGYCCRWKKCVYLDAPLCSSIIIVVVIKCK